MIKTAIFLISTLLFLTNAFSQETKNNVYEISQETKKKIDDYNALKSNYFKYASENMASLTKDQINKLLRYKLNLKNVQEINKLIDDDIVNIVLNRNWDYKSKAVFRPQVIIGTVVSQTFGSREDAFFQTEWTIRIDEIIADDGNKISNSSEKNDLIGTDVYIKSMEGKYRSITHMKRLSIDEKALLFIAPIRNLGRRRFLNESEMLDKFNISSIHKLDKSFTITGKFTIESNTVFGSNGNRIGTLDTVKRITQQITDINNQAQFKKDFSIE